jgi:hypothetical protein
MPASRFASRLRTFATTSALRVLGDWFGREAARLEAQ